MYVMTILYDNKLHKYSLWSYSPPTSYLTRGPYAKMADNNKIPEGNCRPQEDSKDRATQSPCGFKSHAQKLVRLAGHRETLGPPRSHTGGNNAPGGNNPPPPPRRWVVCCRFTPLDPLLIQGCPPCQFFSSGWIFAPGGPKGPAPPPSSAVSTENGGTAALWKYSEKKEKTQRWRPAKT